MGGLPEVVRNISGNRESIDDGQQWSHVAFGWWQARQGLNTV
jgi:hypothetical protein